MVRYLDETTGVRPLKTFICLVIPVACLIYFAASRDLEGTLWSSAGLMVGFPIWRLT
jgi:hypothetical protein